MHFLNICYAECGHQSANCHNKIIGGICHYVPITPLVYGYYSIAAAELFIELLFVGIE